MNTLETFLEIIESRLDIKNCLKIENNTIIPNKTLLTKKYIKEHFLDDLFQYHEGKLIFSNRFMSFVSEITDRKVLTGHYSLELR